MSDHSSATGNDAHGHPGKRVCSGCDLPLSRYNTGPLCQACISKGRAEHQSSPDKIAVDGRKIAELRLNRGWTQSIFADRIGFTVDLVKKLEQPRRGGSVRLSTLNTVAHVLQVPLTDLLKSSSQGVPSVRESAASQPSAAVKPAGISGTYELHTRFSAELTHFMKIQDVSARELARRSHFTPGYISYLRSGNRRPALESAQLIDNVLNAGGRLAEAAMADIAEAEKKSSQQQLLLRSLGFMSTTGFLNFNQIEDKEIERRRLLQSAAVLGVAISPVGRALETLRTDFGSSFGYHDGDHLDDWDETIAEYGYAYLTTQPLKLIPDLAADLATIRAIYSRIAEDSLEYRGWCRIGGALSGLMAKSLSNLGDARDSRQWWKTAQHSADASGDLNLRLWIRGQRLIHGLYENRPSKVLLRQIEGTSELAHGHICSGLADVSTGRAQALVLSGDYRAAEKELYRAEEILNALPSAVTNDTDSIMGWGEAQLRYTETWLYAHMGDEDNADRAAQRALQLYPRADSRSPVQIKLMQAFARIRSGDISQGIQTAQAVYEPLVSGQFTTMVDALASRVLNCVPAEARNRADVTGYRELVASAPQRMIEA